VTSASSNSTNLMSWEPAKALTSSSRLGRYGDAASLHLVCVDTQVDNQVRISVNSSQGSFSFASERISVNLAMVRVTAHEAIENLTPFGRHCIKEEAREEFDSDGQLKRLSSIDSFLLQDYFVGVRVLLLERVDVGHSELENELAERTPQGSAVPGLHYVGHRNRIDSIPNFCRCIIFGKEEMLWDSVKSFAEWHGGSQEGNRG
jgi:hypothetical protein